MTQYSQPPLPIESWSETVEYESLIWELPKEWGLIKLGKLVAMKTGFACAKKNLVSQGLPHLRPFNISTSGELNLTEVYYIPENFIQNPGEYALDVGHVLFNNTNSVELVGKTAIVRESLKWAFSNHLTRLTILDKNRLMSEWLAFALRQLWVTGFFAANCNKWIGQAGFNTEMLSAVNLPLPYPDDPVRSLAEQRRIVARVETLLAEVRETRKINEAIIEDTNQLMDAFIQEVMDHPGDNWKTAQLSDVAQVQTGTAKGRRFGNRKTVEFPYLRVANVQAGYLNLDEIKTIQIAEDEIERYKLQSGDLLLTEGGDFDKLGRGAIWRDEIALCIHQNHVFAVRFNQSEVLPEFAEYEMQSQYAKTYFLSVAKRTTNLASINKIQLSAFPIRYPSKKEQYYIVKYLDTVKAEIKAMQEIQARDEQVLAQVEQAILAQAFRGEL